MNQLLTLQQKAGEYLIADPGALQILLLIQLNACHLHQCVLNAANGCGCVSLSCAPVTPPADWDCTVKIASGDNLGKLCPNCRAAICDRLGALLFYIAALCSSMNLTLPDICESEIEKLDLLGYFFE